MAKGFFITGTDTGVGKSFITAMLLHRLAKDGLRVAGMKPVASGCEETAEGLRNEDALLMQRYASVHAEYALINPYAFVPAIAPHLAAQRASVTIDFAPILANYARLQQMSEAVIVEGAGGWLVPLNDSQTIADLAAALQLPVIIVVAIRLGCINHALLTAQAVRASGCTLAGWIANHTTDPAGESAENIASIDARIDAPLLGTVPFSERASAEAAAAALRAEAIYAALG